MAQSAGEGDDVHIPGPLSPAPWRLFPVGQFGATSVEAEDFGRRLGNWGAASQLIGDRWERVCAPLIVQQLPWTLPLGGGATFVAQAVLDLDADTEAGPVLQRAGVSAPDLILLGTLGAPVQPDGAAPGDDGERHGRLALRAVDCKVSLDTADREQTAPGRLQATLARISTGFPTVTEALRRQAAATGPQHAGLAVQVLEAALAGRWDEVLAVEGLFIAPDNGFNRWFVAQMEHYRRTGTPLPRLPAFGPRRTEGTAGTGPEGATARLGLASHLFPTTAASFLGNLPGWPEAAVVAEADGGTLERMDLSVAERTWRVGVGLRGAILAINRPLFHGPLVDRRPNREPLNLAPVLQRVLKRKRPADSAGLVAAVAYTLGERAPLWERESALIRSPLSYTAWRMALHVHRSAQRRSARRTAAGSATPGTVFTDAGEGLAEEMEFAGHTLEPGDDLGAYLSDDTATTISAPLDQAQPDQSLTGGEDNTGQDLAGQGQLSHGQTGQDLADQGQPAPGQIPSDRAAYRRLSVLHRRRVIAAARELEAQGVGETAILEALEARRDGWRTAFEQDMLAPPVGGGEAPGDSASGAKA